VPKRGRSRDLLIPVVVRGVGMVQSVREASVAGLNVTSWLKKCESV